MLLVNSVKDDIGTSVTCRNTIQISDLQQKKLLLVLELQHLLYQAEKGKKQQYNSITTV
jgi:hypothetical protein